jgi:hypothetical protein
MGDADADAVGGNKGRRSTFTSPMAFLHPSIAAALSSSPGALGSTGSGGGSSKPQHHKMSGASLSLSLSLSNSISRSGGLRISGLFLSPVVVVEQFGKKDEEVGATAEGSTAMAGPETTTATRGSFSPSPPPPFDQDVQDEGKQPQAQQAQAGQQPGQPQGKPPRSPRSLLQRRGNASPPAPGRRQGAKLRATEKDRGKRDSCSLM